MNRIQDIDLRLLRVFVAVVEAGGFTAAQSSLNVGSSTISLHMSDLEERLGFRLCERGRSGFRLTDRGQTAYDETKRILTMLDNFSGSLAALRQRLAGRLVLGVVDCLTTHPLFPIPKALRQFNKLEHDVHIELVVATRLELEKAVIAGHMHAAVVPFVRKINGLAFKPLFREVHRLYVGKGHPLFEPNKDHFKKEEITPHRFVIRSYQEQYDEITFPPVSYAATANSMEAMLSLLLAGSYVGFLPDHFANYWVERGELRRVNCPSFTYISQHQLAFIPMSKMPAAFQAFSDILAKVVTIDHAIDEDSIGRSDTSGVPA